jgi:hypothetical protein
LFLGIGHGDGSPENWDDLITLMNNDIVDFEDFPLRLIVSSIWSIIGVIIQFDQVHNKGGRNILVPLQLIRLQANHTMPSLTL